MALVCLVPLTSFTSSVSNAQTKAAAPAKELADGEIRKIDIANRKVTLKHGVIKSLDMPPMTMVFNFKEEVFFDKRKIGDKVKFSVVSEAGKMMITHVETVE